MTDKQSPYLGQSSLSCAVTPGPADPCISPQAGFTVCRWVPLAGKPSQGSGGDGRGFHCLVQSGQGCSGAEHASTARFLQCRYPMLGCHTSPAPAQHPQHGPLRGKEPLLPQNKNPKRRKGEVITSKSTFKHTASDTHYPKIMLKGLGKKNNSLLLVNKT